MDLSFSEENYIKVIYHLSENSHDEVSTSAIATNIHTRPASVSDMLKKLAKKGVIRYEKYKGAILTEEGRRVALWIIRKHRLWEVFLVEKLKFRWDEVHEVAEQLEHIRSKRLIERLDAFLEYPKYDPHGDPIPDKDGELNIDPQCPISKAKIGSTVKVAAVKDTAPAFLKYLDKIHIKIGTTIKILEIISYDNSMEICIDDDSNKTVFISKEVAQNILIRVSAK